MKTSDMPLFAVLMHTLGEFYGKEISETLSEMYWNSWKRFEWKDVKKAVGKHMDDPKTGQFMPKTCQIVGWIEGTPEIRALQAWAKVTQAISRIGAYRSVAFDDPIIHSVISTLGGWIKLCMSKTSDLPFIGHDFQKHYLAFLNDPPNSFPTHLIGRMPSDPPIQIVNVQNSENISLESITKKLEKMQGK